MILLNVCVIKWLFIKGGLLFSLKPKIPESIRGTTNVIKHQPPADFLQTTNNLQARRSYRVHIILAKVWFVCSSYNTISVVIMDLNLKKILCLRVPIVCYE